MRTRRPWALPLVPVYGAALAAKDALRAAGVLRGRALCWPVISVGSLSAGGAGKTPLAIALAKLLQSRGWQVDVLSRGYGRAGKDVERVDPQATQAAARFGDEPVLIAEHTGVPVWVGASRYAAGRAAEQASGVGDAVASAKSEAVACAHILDDGMQHRQLTRQFELVIVTAEDLVDKLLPAGNLREPLSALRRADALVVREEEIDVVTKRVRALGMTSPVWTVRRTLHFPEPLGVFSAGLRPLAFCAIARPEGFAKMLAEAGCGVVDTLIFDDHHRYREHDMTTIVRTARELQATGLVTTEKDAVKLCTAMRAQLEAAIGPLVVVRLEASFVYEAPVMRALESSLRTVHAQAGEQVGAGAR